MDKLSSLDLSHLPSGPDLLLQNTFRLSQMPVDSPDRQLKRRQQRLDQAKKRGTEPPVGECPIFPVELSSSEDELKEALHQFSDPIRRLFDELFWFWPSKYGYSEADTGLRLLAENRIAEAIKFWSDDEKQSGNYVSTHNLALLYQVIALDSDTKGITENIPLQVERIGFFGIGGSKETPKKQWKSAYKRWNVLCKQDLFWQFVEERIKDINSPRLPPESAQWLRQQLPNILLSVNVGLASQASDKGLKDHLENQKNIIKESGFSTDQVEQVYDDGSKLNRDRIKSLCTNLVEEVKRQPVQGSSAVRIFIEQTSPLLASLNDFFPSENRIVTALHDEVANTIHDALISYTNKTEDWEGALEIIALAKKIARSDKVSEQLGEDKELWESYRDMDSDWCEKGYFELPEDCVDILEKARELQDAEQFDEAIAELRNALQGYAEVQLSTAFKHQLFHCIAHCLKRKAIITYNRGLKEVESKRRQALIDSIEQDGAIYDSHAICCSNGCHITSEYVVRTVPDVDHQFPFCKRCNQLLENNLDKLENEFDRLRREALNLIVLANHLNSSNKSISENLGTICQATDERKIHSSSIDQLVNDWDLLTASELIENLVQGSGERTQVFERLSGIIDRQSDTVKEQTLVELFDAAISATDIAQLIVTFYSNNYLFSRFLKYALFYNDDSKSKQDVTLAAILPLEDHRIKFAIVDLVNRVSTDPSKMVNEIFKSLSINVESMVQAGIDSFDEGDCGDLLSRARQNDDMLEGRLFTQILAASSKLQDGKDFALLYRAVFNSGRYKDPFFKTVFSTEKERNSKPFEGLQRGLDFITEPDVLFAVLLELKDRGINVAVQQLEASIRRNIVALAQAELTKNAANWVDGELGEALRFALGYEAEFESQLFLDILNSIEQRGEFAKNLVTAISLIPADRSRLLKLLAPDATSMNVTARDVCFQILAYHWDADLRLIALRNFLMTCRDERKIHITLIRFLADDNDAVRKFAHEQLVTRISESLGLCLEALVTNTRKQRDSLTEILSTQDLSIRFKSQPTFLTLIALIPELVEAEQLKVLQRYLDHFYSASLRETSLEAIGVLKHTKTHGNTTQREMVVQLLNKLRRQSIFWKFRVWKAPVLKSQKVESWWELGVAIEPVGSSDHWSTREPLNARDFLMGEVQETTIEDPRKNILVLARESTLEHIPCPYCKDTVRKNKLIAHFDKVHRNDSGTAPATSTSSITVVYPDDTLDGKVPGSEPRLLPDDDPVTSNNLGLRPAALILVLIGGLYVGLSENPDVVEARETLGALVGRLYVDLSENPVMAEGLETLEILADRLIREFQFSKNRVQDTNTSPSLSPQTDRTTTTKSTPSEPVELAAPELIPLESVELVVPELTPEKNTVTIDRAEVREAQKILTILGYKPGPVDGFWGQKTKRAMQAFQKKLGLPITSNLNPQTFTGLQSSAVKHKAEDKRKQEVARKLAEARNKVIVERLTKLKQKQKSKEAEQHHLVEQEQKRHAAELKARLQVEENQQSPDLALVAYVLAIKQKIERNWRQPRESGKIPTCEVHVTQGPGGIILDVAVRDCAGASNIYRQSIVNAVYKAEPLPKPDRPELFDRELIILFDPR